MNRKIVKLVVAAVLCSFLILFQNCGEEMGDQSSSIFNSKAQNSEGNIEGDENRFKVVYPTTKNNNITLERGEEQIVKLSVKQGIVPHKIEWFEMNNGGKSLINEGEEITVNSDFDGLSIIAQVSDGTKEDQFIFSVSNPDMKFEMLNISKIVHKHGMTAPNVNFSLKLYLKKEMAVKKEQIEIKLYKNETALDWQDFLVPISPERDVFDASITPIYEPKNQSGPNIESGSYKIGIAGVPCGSDDLYVKSIIKNNGKKISVKYLLDVVECPTSLYKGKHYPRDCEGLGGLVKELNNGHLVCMKEEWKQYSNERICVSRTMGQFKDDGVLHLGGRFRIKDDINKTTKIHQAAESYYDSCLDEIKENPPEKSNCSPNWTEYLDDNDPLISCY